VHLANMGEVFRGEGFSTLKYWQGRLALDPGNP
jgi:hypothetical protein